MFPGTTDYTEYTNYDTFYYYDIHHNAEAGHYNSYHYETDNHKTDDHENANSNHHNGTR